MSATVVQCPHCIRPVVLLPDETCPSCRHAPSAPVSVLAECRARHQQQTLVNHQGAVVEPDVFLFGELPRSLGKVLSVACSLTIHDSPVTGVRRFAAMLVAAVAGAGVAWLISSILVVDETTAGVFSLALAFGCGFLGLCSAPVDDCTYVCENGICRFRIRHRRLDRIQADTLFFSDAADLSAEVIEYRGWLGNRHKRTKYAFRWIDRSRKCLFSIASESLIELRELKHLPAWHPYLLGLAAKARWDLWQQKRLNTEHTETLAGSLTF